MPFNMFRRQLNERERAVADRLPPGQYLTEKWPVLHYGGVPRVDPATWDLRVDGLVEHQLRLTHDDVRRLPRTELNADIHCVTRWSLLESTWGGIALSEVLAEARVKPAATHVLVHAEHGYTTNLSLEDFLRRSEEHTSELQSLTNLVCRLLLEKKKTKIIEDKIQNN